MCGGRLLSESEAYLWLLRYGEEAIARELPPGAASRPTLIISGCAVGGDRAGERWAETLGVPVLSFPPDSSLLPDWAPLVRNSTMLSEGRPDVCLALPGGAGTDDMACLCEAAGLPTVRIVSLGPLPPWQDELPGLRP